METLADLLQAEAAHRSEAWAVKLPVIKDLDAFVVALR